MPPDRNGFEFCRGRDDLKKAFEFGALFQGERIDLDRNI